MAHFQVIANPEDHRRFFTKGDSGTERIILHQGARVPLQQWGYATGQKTVPDLYSSNPSVAEISDVKRTGHRQTFLLTAKNPGTVKLNGKRPYQAGPGGPTVQVDDVYVLEVVVGDFQNHPGMKVDLLAEKMGRSNNAGKIRALNRILNNNADDANLFHQQSALNVKVFKNPLMCGAVASNAGTIYLGKVDSSKHPYHKPVTRVRSRDDVRYDPGTMNRARSAIKALLEKGAAVRVGCSHHPASQRIDKGALVPGSDGGHYVLIVGCNETADRFLYVDPWDGGSKFKYEGGVRGASQPAAPCNFLGQFTLETMARGPVLWNKDAQGTFNVTRGAFLEVITGPL